MLRLKCWIKGHSWLATKWLNDDPYDPRHIVYCSNCGKKKITYA